VSLRDRVRAWWRGPEPALEPLILPALRHPELEAQIAEDPASLEPYLVYADWLQEQGERWGELIAVQVALEQARDLESRQELLQREQSLQVPLHLERLRPFAPWFRRGFVTRLHLPERPGARELLQEALRADPLPLRLLEELVLPRGTRLPYRRRSVRTLSSSVVEADPRLGEPLEGTLHVEVDRGEVGVSVRAHLPTTALSWVSLTSLSESARFPYGGDVTASPDTIEGQTPLSFVCWVAPWPGRRRVHILVRLRLDTIDLLPLCYEASAEIEASDVTAPLLLWQCSPRDPVRAPPRGDHPLGGRVPRSGPYAIPATHPRLPELRWNHQGAGTSSYHPQPDRAACLLSIDTLSEGGITALLWRDGDGKHGYSTLPDAGHRQRPSFGQTWVLEDGSILAKVSHTWWLDPYISLSRAED
jgi:uncharacterized protein (TIGR02996 family)